MAHGAQDAVYQHAFWIETVSSCHLASTPGQLESNKCQDLAQLADTGRKGWKNAKR